MSEYIFVTNIFEYSNIRIFEYIRHTLLQSQVPLVTNEIHEVQIRNGDRRGGMASSVASRIEYIFRSEHFYS